MVTNISSIIRDYQTRCEQHLQVAKPGSDEQLAYDRILRAFTQNPAGDLGSRSVAIARALAFEANSIEALRLAPAEIHEQAKRVRKIVTQWANDFKRDAGHDGLVFTFRRR